MTVPAPVAADPLTAIGLVDDEDIDLLSAALVLAALDRPGLNLTPYEEHLNQLVDDSMRLGTKARDAVTRAAVLTRVIGDRYGYSGDTVDYDLPSNANLIDVIERRRGLPVALGILYIGVARRLGWPATGLNIPAHFILRIGSADLGVLLDPFDGGRAIEADALPQRLRKLGLKASQININVSTELNDRAVLVRLLNNLAARAEANGDLERALIMHQRMTTIAPLSTGLWWERARIEQAVGRMAAARASLMHMLETTHDATLEKRVRAAIIAMARSLN